MFIFQKCKFLQAEMPLCPLRQKCLPLQNDTLSIYTLSSRFGGQGDGGGRSRKVYNVNICQVSRLMYDVRELGEQWHFERTRGKLVKA